MKIDVNGGKRELLDEDKGVRDGISGGSKISFQSVDLKVTANRQQQPQNTAEHWERFLHVRSIRVMLVENDDSTRHIVTALLRNCNYEVIEASNGLQAWKILEDLTNHIDIVLTEVVMPCLSGVALLRKITSHKTRKNIPVIMMSSHDSMGLVFNCLSKGAVDFLVKPIRKNELKNFWQHVWRRCQSSSGSGSGSESGTQTHKSVKSKISPKGDNSGSDDGENNGSNGLNVADGSDDGNGAQSSWTKQAIEFDSSRSLSPIDQVADCPDSTCAQVIRTNTENSGNKGLDIVVAHEQSQPDWSMATKQSDKGQLNLTGECLYNKHKDGSAKIYVLPIDGKDSGTTREVSSILDINNNATNNVSKEPNFELSLKRLRGVQDTGGSVQVDRCIWRRSEQSAFSRYNAASNVFKAPNGITGTASDLQIHSTDHLVYQSPNEVYNNIDMGSTTDKPETTSTMNCLPQVSPNPPNESCLKKFAEEAPQCGSTNVLNGAMDCSDPLNYSLNRSGSGSNHGSSTAFNAVGTTCKKSCFNQGRESGSGGDASGSGSGTGVDENKLTLRQAALVKFRQKRKERSFKKKVQYQTRKRLAEQRPRVRGQFVKKTTVDRHEDE